MDTTIMGHSARTLKDCMPFDNGRVCCWGSAPRSETDATGEPGLGDWKFWELPDVDGMTAFVADGLGLSSCSWTTAGISSNISCIRERKSWTWLFPGC